MIPSRILRDAPVLRFPMNALRWRCRFEWAVDHAIEFDCTVAMVKSGEWQNVKEDARCETAYFLLV